MSPLTHDSPRTLPVPLTISRRRRKLPGSTPDTLSAVTRSHGLERVRRCQGPTAVGESRIGLRWDVTCRVWTG